MKKYVKKGLNWAGYFLLGLSCLLLVSLIVAYQPHLFFIAVFKSIGLVPSISIVGSVSIAAATLILLPKKKIKSAWSFIKKKIANIFIKDSGSDSGSDDDKPVMVVKQNGHGNLTVDMSGAGKLRFVRRVTDKDLDEVRSDVADCGSETKDMSEVTKKVSIAVPEQRTRFFKAPKFFKAPSPPGYEPPDQDSQEKHMNLGVDWVAGLNP